MHSLKFIFEPRSVAVIGASATEGTVGNAIFSNILSSQFKGTVYPVNPRSSHIMCVKAYVDITMIPEDIDLAVIGVPKGAVENVIEQCAKKGVKGLVVITAGFKEVGEEGKAYEDKLIALAEKHDISLIGPNCLGVINTDKEISLNANFAVAMPQSGNVALISQSGAVGIAALGYASLHQLGISKFVSIGNKAVIDESDVLEYLIEDDATRIITMYAEDIKRPVRFLEMARKANAKRKPIIIIKTGTSVRGAIATHSHTGALSSSDTAYDSLFAQCGVIRVESLAELFEFAKGFTSMITPKGKRVVIVTNAGGMGIIGTDAVERDDLEMTTFGQDTLDGLKKVLPDAACVNNPVDILGDADAKRFSDTLSIVRKDKGMDALIVSVTPTVKTDMNAIARTLSDFSNANPDLPILANLMSLNTQPAFLAILEQANIPNFDFPEVNIRVLAAMIRYYEWIKQPKEELIPFDVNKEAVRQVLDTLLIENRTRLSETETYKILEAYGMKVVDYRHAIDLESALKAAGEIGYPVVMKIISPDILHKIDVGGVQVNLKDNVEVKNAFEKISENIQAHKLGAHIQGFLIQKYFTAKGIEVIIGANAIKGFGSLIMFGLGGTYVELFKDVAFKLAPLTQKDAFNMISKTKGFQILKGFRGQSTYDIQAIANYLLRISQLVTDFPEIKEIDLNPIKALEDSQGIITMDAKAIIEYPILPVKEKVRREEERMNC